MKRSTAIAIHPPDVVILDLVMPGKSGFDVVKDVRVWSQVPIIVLSARGQERDKVTALDLGADDYLTKPFGMDELLARIRVALRHRAGTPDASSVVRAGNIAIDLARRAVLRDGERVHLTPTEWDLLAELARNADRVLTHRMLLERVWGPTSTRGAAVSARLYQPVAPQTGSGPRRAARHHHRARCRLPIARRRVARRQIMMKLLCRCPLLNSALMPAAVSFP